MLARIITSIRGNPIALSTLLVSSVALAIGAFIKTDASVMAGAFVGAAVSSLTAMLTAFLGESKLKDLPPHFQNAALADFNERGYYRSRSEIYVYLEDNSQIHFIMKSQIKKFRDNAILRPTIIKPPPELRLTSVKYTINDKDFDTQTEISIVADVSERLEVVYELDPREHGVSDRHTWDCPMDGFTLKMKSPSGYQVTAKSLSGLALNEQAADDGYRVYVEGKAAFSHQGFIWAIKKNS